ncbi:nucleotide excision repair endonuclease [Peribacillus simplex]|uniref:Nucleotide excision repair endonuclease n=2 Tax=Peribacillus TaxID=2675229 RepID=A0AA90P6Q3_9BACI|nr:MULTISPECIES: nucleotide excision repair endonuclease [Peribacillus]MDP1417109.1 nucleotide excision repair endonuclease [Peribacillus simplex]MDP1449764.1 nucleotide excision repair endonuclease [Peribacillus frigoritolerans]
MVMIKIEIPAADISIKQRKQVIEGDEAVIPEIYGFIDFHLIPRDKGGIILFYNEKDELIFVGKARKLRPRVKKHFEDNVSPIKDHRNEVKKIDILLVEDAMEREIYETYMINKLHAKYNVDKVFYK